MPRRGWLRSTVGSLPLWCRIGRSRCRRLDFSEGWKSRQHLLQAVRLCLLTHLVIDAARELHERRRDREISKVDIRVDPMCIQLAGIAEPADASKQVQRRLLARHLVWKE